MSLPFLQSRQRIKVIGASVWLVASSVTLVSTPSSAASPPAQPLACTVSTGNTLHCSTADQGLALDFSIDVTSQQGKQTGYATFEQRTPRSFSIKTAPACGNLTITTSNETGRTQMIAEAHCSKPVQICMVAQVSGAGATLRSGIAYIEGKSGAMGVQSDDRVGTDIDVSNKRLRFCSDPTLLSAP